MYLFNKKAQSTLEYAIIVAVVVGALLTIQIYIKRGIQGRMRSSTDNIGDQYSAGVTTSRYVTSDEGTTNLTDEYVGTDAEGKGVTRSVISQAAVTNRSATGADKETVTTDLTAEGLFSPSGTLWDDPKR
jgi:hypothetical protein